MLYTSTVYTQHLGLGQSDDHQLCSNTRLHIAKWICRQSTERRSGNYNANRREKSRGKKRLTIKAKKKYIYRSGYVAVRLFLVILRYFGRSILHLQLASLCSWLFHGLAGKLQR